MEAEAGRGWAVGERTHAQWCTCAQNAPPCGPPTVAAAAHRHGVAGVAVVGADLQAAGGILLVVDVQLHQGSGLGEGAQVDSTAGRGGGGCQRATLASAARGFRSGRRAAPRPKVGLQGLSRAPQASRVVGFRNNHARPRFFPPTPPAACPPPAQSRSGPTNAIPRSAHHRDGGEGRHSGVSVSRLGPRGWAVCGWGVGAKT
jgi:hypothetical protein